MKLSSLACPGYMRKLRALSENQETLAGPGERTEAIVQLAFDSANATDANRIGDRRSGRCVAP